MIRNFLSFALVVLVMAGCGAPDTPTTKTVASAAVAVSQITTAVPEPSPIAVSVRVVSTPSGGDTLVTNPEYPPFVQPYPAYVRVPEGIGADTPLTLVIALHGMSGEGKGFASMLVNAADRNHWVLAGPTIPYGDWRNADSVAKEDATILQRLHATIQRVPALIGRRLKPRVKLFGFSRGAQVAHRYALAYPEDVSSVVAYSAGTYTLPLTSADVDMDGKPDALMFPYGIADLATRIGHSIDRTELKHIVFLIGVGANDNRPGDVPRQWDSYVGKSRVERAQQFHNVLKKSGASCTLKVFPATDHEVTREMLSLAENFFASDEAAPTSLQP